MLYDPANHEPLAAETWDADRARNRVREIVADADEAFDPARLWPAQEWDVWQATAPLKELYVGASGVIWALDVLRRRGLAETRIDLAAAALRTLELWRELPDYAQWEGDLPSAPAAALLAGESGPLLVAWRLAPSAGLAEDLLARVRENLGNEAVEVMWGAPGTALAAKAMFDWTGEERWRDAWLESAESIWAMRDADGLWTNRLYGETFRSLTPPHGLVGNVHVLRGALESRRESLERDTVALLARLAVTEDGVVNWPAREGGEPRHLQWCHGAPGILVAAGDYLDEELVLTAADLIWQAGPSSMEKGSGICHGTSGNGYALLRVFERTGDEQWLDRARLFAAHALGQVERRGTGRYSLWTGDVGVALFAAGCLEPDASYPVFDF